MERTAIVIKEQDNVATAIKDIPAGQEAAVGIGEQVIIIPVTQDIAYGHKFALRPIAKGEAVLKYSCVIGRATGPIPQGCGWQGETGRGDRPDA